MYLKTEDAKSLGLDLHVCEVTLGLIQMAMLKVIHQNIPFTAKCEKTVSQQPKGIIYVKVVNHIHKSAQTQLDVGFEGKMLKDEDL
jgi:hypothetical protein